MKGPVTRKDFEIFNVYGGEDMFGRVCDHIGRHLTEYDEDAAASTSVQPVSRSAATGTAAGGGSSSSSSRFRPLINQQVDMKNREQINESLLTGVKVRLSLLAVHLSADAAMSGQYRLCPEAGNRRGLENAKHLPISEMSIVKVHAII